MAKLAGNAGSTSKVTEDSTATAEATARVRPLNSRYFGGRDNVHCREVVLETTPLNIEL